MRSPAGALERGRGKCTGRGALAARDRSGRERCGQGLAAVATSMTKKENS